MLLPLLLLLLTLSAAIYTQVRSILPQQWDNIVLLRNLTIPGIESPVHASPYLRAVAAYHRGDYTAAFDFFRKLSLDDKSLSRHWIASSLAASGEWRQAIDQLDLNYAHDRELMASILLPRLPSMIEYERSEWEQLIRSSVPEIALKYAAILLANGEYEKSDWWAHVVPNYDQSQEAQLISGQSYFYRSGQMETAVRIFDDTYRRFPNAATAYWLGRALAYQGQVKAAIPLLQEAVNSQGVSSTLAWYLLELGAAYVKIGRCQDVVSVVVRFDELAIKMHLPPELMSGKTAILSECGLYDTHYEK